MIIICQEKSNRKDSALIWANILLVVVTSIYVLLTYNQLGVAQQQLVLDRRPYVTFNSLTVNFDSPSSEESLLTANHNGTNPTYKLNNIVPQIQNLGKSFAYFSIRKMKITFENKLSYEPTQNGEWRGILAPQATTNLPILDSPIEIKQFPLTGIIEYRIDYQNNEHKDKIYSTSMEFEFTIHSVGSPVEVKILKQLELPD